MANAWLMHVKKTMKAHKGAKFGAVLKMAKKTYKGGSGLSPADYAAEAPAQEGGSATLSPLPVGGRRRRSRKGTKKTRRSRK
jgi:hypothetical protein